MIHLPCRTPIAIGLLFFTVGISAVAADDAEAVREKLFQAKKEYDSDLRKYKQAGADWLEKREDEARKAGNIKMVDRVKDERAIFEKTGELPQLAPNALRDTMGAARTKLDKAYTAAVKQLLQLKMDEAADALEKERQEFLRAASLLSTEAVKDRLALAKVDYEAEIPKFKKAVADWLDKRESDARTAGNVKLVEQVKAERAEYEKTGEIPSSLPIAVRESLNAARMKFDQSYAAAVKELRAKKSEAADALEKEREDFYLNSALVFGKKVYLSSLKHFDVKVWKNSFNNTGTFDDGKVKVEVNGAAIPHSLFLHPTSKAFSQVRYPLAGKYSFFRAALGVPNIRNQGNPISSLTFEVLADDKSVWKSEPVTRKDEFQTCTIRVEKVKTLTLRVNCSGGDTNAWAYWIEPILVE